MRTKTLLLTAALSAAGLATSLAQSNVYSLNIVGYVNQTYPAGFSMVATPLRTSNNIITQIIPDPPVGTVVFKFTGGAYEAGNTYFGAGFWGNNNQSLPPGQGYFIKSPSAWTNTYVGEVVTDSTNSLIAGFNMIGSAYPAAGAMDTNLSLVPVSGDIVFKFNNGGAYDPGNTYFGSGFWGAGNPQLSVGQGVFYKSVGANNWIQHFTP